MRRSRKLNKAWLNEHLNDPWVKLAQKEGFRARAAYKLLQIDDELEVLTGARVVVDLGAAPGAWSQAVRRRVPAATVYALDLLPMAPVDGVEFVQGDFRDEASAAELERRLAGRPVDALLSDMAPNLSGIESADSARIADLVELTVDFAARHLASDGRVVCKVFHGSGYGQWVRLFKDHFRQVRAVKPRASRDRSAETFLVGRALKKARAAPKSTQRSDALADSPPGGGV